MHIETNQAVMAHHARRGPRRALAPLELVLGLPVLLFVMALMVNFATGVNWKVRTSNASRLAVWRARYPRTGRNDGHPPAWPATARMGVEDTNMPGRIFEPVMNIVVAYGEIGVDPSVFGMERGMRKGTANIEGLFPMLPKLRSFKFNIGQELIDDAWQFPTEGMKHMPHTVYRRIPIYYFLPKADPSIREAFVAAVQQVMFGGFRPALATLDRDEELRGFYGHYVDFHPHLPHPCCTEQTRCPCGRWHPNSHGYCGLDPEFVRRVLTEQLIHHIKGHCVTDGRTARVVDWGVPGHMTGVFLGMYEAKKAALEAQIAQMQNQDPPNPGAIAGLMAQIAALEPSIKQLREFAGVVEEQIKRECRPEGR